MTSCFKEVVWLLVITALPDLPKDRLEMQRVAGPNYSQLRNQFQAKSSMIFCLGHTPDSTSPITA